VGSAPEIPEVEKFLPGGDTAVRGYIGGGMAKVSRGRLTGMDGMNTHSSAELSALADTLEKKLSDPADADDPRWVRRRVVRLRQLARQKEDAALQKARQRRRRTRAKFGG